jgi:hypothetical protein
MYVAAAAASRNHNRAALCQRVLSPLCAQFGIMAFAYSQLVYALVLVAAYFYCFARAIQRQEVPLHSVSQLLPSTKGLQGVWFDYEVIHLWKSFALQAVEKLVLTEGEKIVLRFGDSLLHQATFGVVHNLGTMFRYCRGILYCGTQQAQLCCIGTN